MNGSFDKIYTDHFYRPRSVHLLRFEQAATYLQSNPYLRGGYRPHLSWNDCIASIFKWTNETINIWTHLLGFGLFVIFLIRDIFVLIPTLKLSIADSFCMILFVLCALFCLGSSTMYHTFSCHDEKTYRRYLKRDIDSIAIMIMGVYAFGIQTIFHCHDTWRIFYHSITAVFSVLVLGLHYKTQQKSPKDHIRMMVILASWITLGLVIPIHFVQLEGGFYVAAAQPVLIQALFYYVFLGGGFFFYLTRYPEKCCPGKVDYFGASHQLWHVLALSAFTWWHQRCVNNLTYSRCA